MKFLINKKITSNIPNAELFNLGLIDTDINDLLNGSIINIDQNTIPVLKINDSHFLINNFNPNDYKEDFEILLTESDLISFGGSGSGGGDFIPLTGTEVGSPVTGDIHSISNFFIDYDNGDPFASILPVDRIIYLGDAIGNYNSTQIGINDVQQKVNINAFLGTRVTSGENIVLEIYSASPTSRGIVGLQDYTPNITDLDYTQKIYVDQKVADSRPYKVYTALLSQTETDAPTAIVLENTLGGTIVWTYDRPGVYLATLTGVFIVGKTTVNQGTLSNTGAYMQNYKQLNVIELYTFNNLNVKTDDMLGNTEIEIRVYN